jgi:hypothetical protein
MKIYFPQGDTATTLKELLTIGFSKSHAFVETYFDEEFTLEQCHSARRSFGDLLLIAQTYFPDTTPEKLAYELMSYMCFYCPTIKKLVFLNEPKIGFNARCSTIYKETYKDSDNLCYNDILNLANNDI